MRVIPPFPIVPASSSVAEPAAGETVWVSGAIHTVGAIRIRTETHRRYECMVDITSTTPPEDDPAHWRDAGPTNKWAMFDLASSLQTEAVDEPLVVTITPGRRASSIGLLGLHGSSMLIEQLVDGEVQHEDTINLLLRKTVTWTQYYYGAFRVLKQLVRFNLPLSVGATIRLTIQPNAGYARCGAVVVGMSEDLGLIVNEPVSDQLSLSKVERDKFGVATLNKRRSVPQNTHRVRAPASRLDRLMELRDDLDASPALFSGADDREGSHFFDALLVLGFPRKWAIAMKGMAVHSDIQLEQL